MVFPIGDDNTDRDSFPIVNVTLIAVNVFVFVFLQRLGDNDRVTYAWSVVPEEIVTGRDLVTPGQEVTDPVSRQPVWVPGLQPTPGSVYLTLLTSMFLHGGLLHLLGNMWFLWVFGDNVEDRLGKGRYLLFYLLCGVLASLAHVWLTVATGHDTRTPCLGASGAISGVLGAYLVFFPQKRVTVILFRVLAEVPAFVAVGTWFLFQLITGLGALGDASRAGGGVAYAAHVGGFVAGLALAPLFALGRRS
jgi:membrane associated rhomboid family serine protease